MRLLMFDIFKKKGPKPVLHTIPDYSFLCAIELLSSSYDVYHAHHLSLAC